MAASLVGVQPADLQQKIKSSKILVVGAGGIGCEVLKNLVLSGFDDITIIDLDTIDLSNLNRQFLFQREHVGKSKAQVAKESALKFNPDVKIEAFHDSIFSTDYGVNFFKKFDVVLNALDNRAARNHVNRMCLNSEVPLIESGTAGYNGQVELIKRGLTQCYECTPKAAQKSYPGCTIRNTPSEPVHCIVWAKHLFNQLFGETVEDEDISPDMADPEAQAADENEEKGDGDKKTDAEKPDTGNIVRINTRQWAKEIHYEPEALFNKFFYDDIKYLLSMANLWKTRKAPEPMQWSSFDFEKETSGEEFRRQYHNVWTPAECGAVFADCLKQLSAKLSGDEPLVWDKDDQPAMDFVAACANIRAYIFSIARKSRFEVKSIAGNIIPAIATTNAITAGMVVLQTFRVLKGQFERCKSVYMRLHQNPRQQIVVPERTIMPPNPKCYVCASEPAINLRVDTKRVTIKEFRDDILIKALNMVVPDVTVDAKGIIVISSEEDETKCNEEKLLADMDIVDGVILKCDDFFQNYELSIIIEHFDAGRDDPLFEVNADPTKLQPKKEEAGEDGEEAGNGDAVDEGPSTSKKARLDNVAVEDDDDDDLCIIEDDAPMADESGATDKDVTEATNKLQVASDDEDEVKEEEADEEEEEEEENRRAAMKRKPSAISISDDDEIHEISDSDDDDEPLPPKRSRIADSTDDPDAVIEIS